jgi:putative oxidoreductase
MKSYLQPISRGLVALIFIFSGIGKVAAFSAVAGMMAGAGFPLPSLFLAGAIAIEIIGGLALLAGYKNHYASLSLIIFLIPATLIFHAASISDPAHGQEQLIQVLKNLAIIGALVNFATNGAGAYSLDSVSKEGEVKNDYSTAWQ